MKQFPNQFIDLSLTSTPNVDSPITARETEVLQWTALGKTAWEISVIISVTERTVNAHLQRAAKKLGAANKTHAITIALIFGWLTLAVNMSELPHDTVIEKNQYLE
jgi:DNA-binding CsgD family transcriptional regulator